MAAFQDPSFTGYSSREPSAIPGVYNGMRVDVLDDEDKLLFVAGIESLSAETIKLVQTSEPLRPGLGGGVIPVSIRGFNAYENCGIHIDGVLSKPAPDREGAWLVKELDVKGKDNGRSFNRRPIRAQAWACPEDAAEAGTEAEWLVCEVVNASAGGVCFRTTGRFSSGDRLSIRFDFRHGKEQPPVMIVVRRASSRGESGESYEYGCEFVLNSEVDAIIPRIISQLQFMR